MLRGIMYSFFVGSFVLKIVVGSVYVALVQQSDHMTTTKNAQLNQCKARFLNCYRLNEGVHNVSIFVERFIRGLRLGPFSLEGILQLSSQTMFLGIVCAGIEICRGIAQNRDLMEIFPYYIICFTSIYIYYAISGFMNIKEKKEQLKVNLVDYLENHYIKRLELAKKRDNSEEDIAQKEPVLNSREELLDLLQEFLA